MVHTGRSHRVRCGDPAAEIVQEASEGGYDLLVVGKRDEQRRVGAVVALARARAAVGAQREVEVFGTALADGVPAEYASTQMKAAA